MAETTGSSTTTGTPATALTASARIKHLSHVSQRVEREPYVIPPRTDRIEVLSWVSRRRI